MFFFRPLCLCFNSDKLFFASLPFCCLAVSVMSSLSLSLERMNSLPLSPPSDLSIPPSVADFSSHSL